MAEDVVEFTKELHLENCSYYGFSDGGIIGLIVASKYPDLFKNLIVSGANTNPRGIRRWIYYIFKILNFFCPTCVKIALCYKQSSSGKKNFIWNLTIDNHNFKIHGSIFYTALFRIRSKALSI